MNPGATIRPLASKISTPLREETLPLGATSAMRSPSSKISNSVSVFRAGSTTRPFLTSSMRRILYVRSASIPQLLLRVSRGVRTLVVVPGSQQEEQRHAHRDAVSHLLQHA